MVENIVINGVKFPLVATPIITYRDKNDVEKKRQSQQVLKNQTSNLENFNTWALPYISLNKLKDISEAVNLVIPSDVQADSKASKASSGFTTNGKSLEWVWNIAHKGLVGKSISGKDSEGRDVQRNLGNITGWEDSSKLKNDKTKLETKLNVSMRILKPVKDINEVLAESLEGVDTDAGSTIDREYEEVADYKNFRNHPQIQAWVRDYLVDKDGEKLQDAETRVRRLWLISLYAKPERLKDLEEARDSGDKQKENRALAKISTNPYELAFMNPDATPNNELKPADQKVEAEKIAKRAFEGYVKEPHMKHPITQKESKQTKKGKPSGRGWYGYAKAYRSYLQPYSSIKFIRGEKGMFQQSTKGIAGHYAHLKANEEELAQLDKCISAGSEKMVTKIKSSKKVHSGKLGIYLAYRIIMECGFRRDEIYTIATGEPIQRGAKNEDADSGTTFTGTGADRVYHLTAYTRKTAWVDRYVHTASVLNPEVNALITERLDQVQKGKAMRGKKDGKKIAMEQYGVKLDSLNDKHTLVGWDDEFVKVNTMGQKKPTGVSANQTIANDTLRECYEEVRTENGLKELSGKAYWLLKPLHYLRHLFAHKWLDQTKYNYGLVAKWGHWGTISELERSYGEMPNKFVIEEMQQALKDSGSKTVSDKAVAEAIKTDEKDNDTEPESKPESEPESQ